MAEAKPFIIDKWTVHKAFKKVKENRGSAGIDNIDIKAYEKKLTMNLYKLWNRMSSGTYFPKPVKLVEIPKPNGGTRPLGIPTVEDRVAQMVVVMYINERLEAVFHEDSYAYRPNRSTSNAIAVARERCFRYSWVLDMDISKFFDTIDHELLMKAVRKHVSEKWILLYIERWLKVPYQTKDGKTIERDKGVPQGSVIGPVLANLFLTYVFDLWMKKHYSNVPFERYADDTICHCWTRQQAEELKATLIKRFEECKLKLNEEKTKIVYCKDSNRRCNNAETSFDFLGFTFRGRGARNSKTHQVFTAFLPAMSKKSFERKKEEIRSWKYLRNYHLDIEDLSVEMEDSVRGWISYYTKWGKTEFYKLMNFLNERLVQWARKKYKHLKRQYILAKEWLVQLSETKKYLFYHWQRGYVPYRYLSIKNNRNYYKPKFNTKSRVMGDCQARFCERGG